MGGYSASCWAPGGVGGGRGGQESSQSHRRAGWGWDFDVIETSILTGIQLLRKGKRLAYTGGRVTAGLCI